MYSEYHLVNSSHLLRYNKLFQVIPTFAKYQFRLPYRLEEAEGGKEEKGIMMWRLYAVCSLSFIQVERAAVREDF